MSAAPPVRPAADEPWQRQRFQVGFSYPVVHTRDTFSPRNRSLVDALAEREPGRRHRVAVFVDAGVAHALPELPARIRAYAQAHAPAIAIAGEIVQVPGGEACKNDPDLVDRLLLQLAERAIDRHSYALVIGGGAVLDAVGFAAAIFHRGVRLVRLPSTVLAQDDSGVGVKNAVNWRGAKNLVGTFAPPWAVINDGCFIDALPAREKRAGMAEAVKVALIRDADFFADLESRVDALAAFEPQAMDDMIRRSAALHMHQIAFGGDPFEHGSARPLDYGHWAAHKLERMTRHALSHGEAVAIGLALDARYSVLAGLLPRGGDERVHRLLARLGFRLFEPRLLERTRAGRLALLEGLAEFREHLGGELTITLLAALGRGIEVHEMDAQRIERSIGWLRQRASVDAAACA